MDRHRRAYGVLSAPSGGVTIVTGLSRRLVVSINVRERPWASKRQPIDYKRCCTDRLNTQAEFSRCPNSGGGRGSSLNSQGLAKWPR